MFIHLKAVLLTSLIIICLISIVSLVIYLASIQHGLDIVASLILTGFIYFCVYTTIKPYKKKTK